MAAPLTISQAPDLVDRSMQLVFTKASEPDLQSPKYFNTRKTTDYYEKDSSLSGLGEADFVDENSVIVSDTGVQGYDKTYTQNMISLIYPFSWKMWRFGIEKRNLNNVAQELKNSIARTKEKLCAERLDNGFDNVTSYTHSGQGGSKSITVTGGDALNAFDDDHTREDGGTNMNNYIYDGTTYNLPFDYPGLKAAHRTASLMVDPRGNPRPAKLDTLVCKTGSSVYYKMVEILGAIKNGKIPESNDNDASGVPAYKIVQLDYLTNASYWFAFDSSRALSEREGFQFVESQGAKIDPPNVVYKTKEIQTSATAIFDLGHNDVTRSWVGSRGTSANPTD